MTSVNQVSACVSKVIRFYMYVCPMKINIMKSQHGFCPIKIHVMSNVEHNFNPSIRYRVNTNQKLSRLVIFGHDKFFMKNDIIFMKISKIHEKYYNRKTTFKNLFIPRMCTNQVTRKRNSK